jgi:hypothetical protein
MDHYSDVIAELVEPTESLRGDVAEGVGRVR